MPPSVRTLLIIDGLVNLLLGVLLLLFPLGLASVLGVPLPGSHFYPSILGAVLFGIGIALMIDAYGAPAGIRGLGLPGAIAINLCGGMVLLGWLLFAPLDLPLRGRVTLWTIAVVVLSIGAVELLHIARRPS